MEISKRKISNQDYKVSRGQTFAKLIHKTWNNMKHKKRVKIQKVKLFLGSFRLTFDKIIQL